MPKVGRQILKVSPSLRSGHIHGLDLRCWICYQLLYGNMQRYKEEEKIQRGGTSLHVHSEKSQWKYLHMHQHGQSKKSYRRHWMYVKYSRDKNHKYLYLLSSAIFRQGDGQTCAEERGWKRSSLYQNTCWYQWVKLNLSEQSDNLTCNSKEKLIIKI